jgi:hypothetical protein
LQQKVSKSGNSVTKKQLLLVKTALKSLGIILPSIKVTKNTKILQLIANLGKCQFYCKKEMFFRMEHFSVPRPVCTALKISSRNIRFLLIFATPSQILNKRGVILRPLSQFY